MSYIKRLWIRGIRAFDPDGEAEVQFERPLTVILGENGCGKTTIIECLKYVATGQMPPNTSRGRDFVHDPSILGRAVVKGQIKLWFGTISRESKLAIRSLQMSAPRGKAKSGKFQSLDGVMTSLVRDKDGRATKSDMAMKASAMDGIMPGLLGVPSAILEHVIFCHQEESTWPLQESTTVKKHFDEIFATTRYSKAMDEVKKKRKGLHEQAGELKATVARLTAHSAEAKRLTAEVAHAEASIEGIASLRDEARERVERCEARLARLQGLVERENKAKVRLEGVRSRIEHALLAMGELREQLVNDYGSDPDDEAVLAKVHDGFAAHAEEVLRQAKKEEGRLAAEREKLSAERTSAQSAATREREARAGLRERVRSLAAAAADTVKQSDQAASIVGMDAPGLPQVLLDAERVMAGAAAYGATGRSKRARPGSQDREHDGGGGGDDGDDDEDDQALAAWTRACMESKHERSTAMAAFLTSVEAQVAQVEERVAEARATGDAEVSSKQEVADKSRRALASLDAEQEQLSSQAAAARREQDEAQAELDSFGFSAESSVARQLDEEQQKQAYIEAEVGRQEAALDEHGGGSILHGELRALQASVRRLRRWRRAAETQAEAHRRVAALAAERDALRRQADDAAAAVRGSISELAPRLLETCGVNLDEKDADGLASAVVAMTRKQAEARQAVREAGERLQVSRSALAEALSLASQLRGQLEAVDSEQESLQAKLEHEGVLASAWDTASGRPVAIAELRQRLTDARQALSGSLAIEDRLDMIESVMGQLATMASHTGSCPVCAKSFDGDSSKEVKAMRSALRKTQKTLQKLQEQAQAQAQAAEDQDSGSGSSSSSSSSSSGGREAPGPEARAEEAQQQVDMASRWEEGSTKAAALASRLEEAEQKAQVAKQQVDAISGEHDAAVNHSQECSSLLRTVDGVNEEWQSMQGLTKQADALDTKVQRSLASVASSSTSSSSSSSLHMRIKLESDVMAEEEEDCKALEGLQGLRDEDDEVITEARGAGGMEATNKAISRLATLLRLREDKKEEKQAEIAKRQAGVAAKRQELAAVRQVVAGLQSKQATIASKAVAVERAGKLIEGIESKLRELRRSRPALQEASDAAAAELDRSRSHRDEAVSKANSHLSEVKGALASLQRSYERFRHEEERDPLQQLQQVQRRLQEAERRLSDASTAMATVTAELDKARQEASSRDRIVAECRLLVSFKKATTTIEALQQEKKDVEAELARLRQALRTGVLQQTGTSQDDDDENDDDDDEAAEEEEYWNDADLTFKHSTLLRRAPPLVGSDEPVSEGRSTKERGTQKRNRGTSSSSRARAAAAAAASAGSAQPGHSDDASDEAEDDDDEDEQGSSRDDGEQGASRSGAAPSRRFSPPAETEGVSERISRLHRRASALKELVAESNGREHTLQEQVVQRKDLLESKELRDVQPAQARANIQLRTTELAVKDLDTFYRGLDRALMRYHELQIEQANETIRELWSLTYQGRDIDTIQIRSDASDMAGGASSSRRSYNYRVVMTKGGSELDMRGRCSAGQKVLACLIIRLALRKAFASTNCGILALDEPTTSLDHENKAALARSLATIITRSKERQRHFQLIIITHDLDFIADLNSAMQEIGAGDGRPKVVNEVRREEHRSERGKFVSLVRCSAWERVAGLHG